jgi:4-diphosphocytidyl-2-C-methyl-D-erythritol kinase
MDLVKRIPAGAGLGGGSSNAATVLKVLNRYFDHPFSFEELSVIALSLGADVPFFLYGQPAIVTGIGERIAPYPRLAPFAVLIVFPGVGLSTATVYRALNLRLTKCEKKLRKFLLKNEAFKAEIHLCNDLELPAIQICPDVAAIKSELLQQGALGAVMSGSGSAVLGLFENTDTARQARRAFADREDWQVFQGCVLV